MILAIDPQQVVVRWRRPDKSHGDWHILYRSTPTGFNQENAPEFPTWWNTTSYRALCGWFDDDRPDTAGSIYKGYRLEFSTVAKISKVCPSCYPPAKLTKGKKR